MALIDIADSDLRLLSQALSSALHPQAPGAVLAPDEFARANLLRHRFQSMLQAEYSGAKEPDARNAAAPRAGTAKADAAKAGANSAPARRSFWDGETVRHVDGREGVVRFHGNLGPLVPMDSTGNALPFLWVDFQDRRECIAVGYLEKIPQARAPGGDGAIWTGTPIGGERDGTPQR